MPDPVQPGRDSDSLADVVELLLDKGVVINADIVVSVGETELLGIKIRAAIASFETASQYGLEFPSGTDMEAVEAASDGRRETRRSEVAPAANPQLAGGDEVEEESAGDETDAAEGTDEEEGASEEDDADGEEAVEAEASDSSDGGDG